MEPSASTFRPDLSHRKILVVDDDRINIRILSGILKAEGYNLAEASSGEQALEVYEKFTPDLVLLDVMLPGINGFDTCRTLHERHGNACAPIIFITAKNESDDVVEGLSVGGVDYLPKPFQPREVTARIRTHLQDRLLLDQLSQANTAKNRFLGMAAHDLRNPLASIRGLAEFLRDGTVGQLTPEQLDLVKTIHDASQSMLTLVNELLDVAAIESGKLQIVRRPGSLSGLIAKAVYLANIEAARKNTRINFTQPATPDQANFDPDRLKQVIENLLSNAIKYSPPGSTITVDFAVTPKGLEFAVKDQGPGIPEGERDRLFKDFSRLSVKPTGGENSTGLGLAICRKIVEAHGGEISAKNLPSLGCEFRVILPQQP